MPSSDLSFNRRELLSGLGAAALLGAFGLGAKHAMVRPAAGASAGARALVLLHFAGGFDVTELMVRRDQWHDYWRVRPTLAPAAPGSRVAADGGMRVGRAWAPLLEAWNRGQLAVLPRVHFPHAGPSHYRAAELWQTAPADTPGVGHTGHEGRARTPLRTDCQGTDARPYPVLTGWLGRAAERIARERGRDVQCWSAGHARAARVFSGATDERVSIGHRREATGGSRLDATLADIGARIGVSGATELYHVTVDGWDSHFDQRRIYDRLGGDVSAALARFVKGLEVAGKAPYVLVMAWSESGRSWAENHQGGTDDVAPAPVLFWGPQLAEAHRLTADAFARAEPIDVRWVYAAVLERWLQCSAGCAVANASAADALTERLLGG